MAQPDAATETSSLITSTMSALEDKDGKTLRKSVGFRQLFACVVGILVGSGVYISPGLVARYTSNMGMAIAVWVASGLISLFGSLCFCELAVTLKKTGGHYIFIKEIYGDFAGFFTVWTSQLVIGPAALAVISVTIGEYVVGAFADITLPNGVWMVKGTSVLCLFVSFFVNSTSTSFTSKTQTFFTSLQLLSVVFFISVGIWKVATGGIKNYTTMFTSNNSESINFKGLGVAFYSALWTFDGWGFVSTVTEELTNRERDLWLAIVTGIPFVITGHVLINVSLMSALSHAEMAKSNIVAMTFVERSLGANAALIVPIIVAFNCSACLNAANFFLSRGILSAAREGHLPEPLAYIHNERRTPVPALLFLFLLSSASVLALGSGTVLLLTYFSFAVWITYGLAIFGTIVLRIKQPDLPRPFKVWIINSGFMSFVSICLILAPYAQSPVECSICFGLLLLSVPVYFIAVRGLACMPTCSNRFKEHVYKSIMWKFDLAMCLYAENHEPDSLAGTFNDSDYDNTNF